jgi:hypothetical protein
MTSSRNTSASAKPFSAALFAIDLAFSLKAY